MRIEIIIDRGTDYSQDTKEGKIAKGQFKDLKATEFPMGIMLTRPEDDVRMLSFSGTVEDFTKAIGIQKEFMAGIIDNTEKIVKLAPINEKTVNDFWGK